MDVTATLSHLVTSLLPAEQAAFVHTHVLRADAPLRVTFSAARASALRGASAAYPYVAPACERALAWTHASQLAVAWAAVAALAAWAWHRGPAESARDLVAAGGRLAGYAAVVRDIWLREYRRYEEQENRGR
ncbi:hypothetical protein ISF_03715 [Cordyceps fumosorosea ARSEF 2679]|uniref:Uncharacterized protein n=1 Tax=Cordyceps fumosorosea (strain ARSEF 2679) TaxID=1081104 RepID=A0A167ZHX6_CORFA|nr:hypothetical protein ISF_03715 [Cordyceps fumosorosea ARSEF 2679]OAA67539.1 hypothetical protein ISF_03715 [Cordyceps fumosorosea ARSEF 2679]